MFTKGSTAVLSTPDIPFIVAVNKAGIYSFEEGEWLLQYGLSQNIYKLVRLGHYIFGIGDYGTIVRYDLQRRKWNHTSFPTVQRLWDITGNDQGLIVTHAGSRLYVSENFGASWSVTKPFLTLDVQPLIRSLLYEKGRVYIGTQVNKDSGGLWSYSFESGELRLVKKEESSMISSIYSDSEDSLIITKGNVHTGEGSVEVSDPIRKRWQRFSQPIQEKAFLDLFSANKKLYATTSRDTFGYSRIYELQREEMSLIPIETIEGHGFRGAGFDEQLFISSPVESKWIANRFNAPVLLH
ncbi:hypothetical protein ACQCT5_01955 [Sutcliffiella halmapala]